MKEEIEKYIITELEIDDAETIAMLVSSYGDSLNENYAIIQAAIAAGDGPRGGAAAHALKGASANIGAQAVYEAALGLEKHLKGGGGRAEAEALLARLAALREQFIRETAS